MNSPNEFIEIYRFGDEGIRPFGEDTLFLEGIIESAHRYDDRIAYGGIVLDLSAEFVAIHTWEIDVEDDDPGENLGQRSSSLESVEGLVYVIAFQAPLEDFLQHIVQLFIIIDDEDGRLP